MWLNASGTRVLTWVPDASTCVSSRLLARHRRLSQLELGGSVCLSAFQCGVSATRPGPQRVDFPSSEVATGEGSSFSQSSRLLGHQPPVELLNHPLRGGLGAVLNGFFMEATLTARECPNCVTDGISYFSFLFGS